MSKKRSAPRVAKPHSQQTHPSRAEAAEVYEKGNEEFAERFPGVLRISPATSQQAAVAHNDPPESADTDPLDDVTPETARYTMPRCPHCSTDPLQLDGVVYEVRGAIRGSMEQWKLLFCRNKTCRAPLFATIIAIKKPENEATATPMQTAAQSRIAMPGQPGFRVPPARPK